MIYILLADGFEEVEALAPLDIMRRCGIDVKTAGLSQTEITGSHNITVLADMKIEDIDMTTVEGIVLPGGLPGTTNLQKDVAVNKLIEHCDKNGLMMAAICAAPMILGELNLLNDHDAVCFPGFEEHLKGADIIDAFVVTSGNIITAKGAGASLEFGEAIVDYLTKDGKGAEILQQMQYPLC